MKFVETELMGAFIIEPERLEDERGFFARMFCEREFAAHGLETRFVQCSISFSPRNGTLRGLHYQSSPHEEAKVVRCTMGAIFDVIIDLRPDSATFTGWKGIELSAENRKAIYVPKGFAHGFLTLVDNSEIFYGMSAFFHPERAAGVRWNDPAFNVDWPGEVCVISEHDRNLPDFRR